MKTFALLVLGLIAAVFIAKYWNQGWMFYGLPRPPDFLEPIWDADGEGIHDRIVVEMILVAASFNTALILFLRRK
ncbi:MAG: hypothetical protein KUG59_04650 [Parvibaculaceae bacterium]|nr:hypothetical protein [Parvibaculaceae bacterium]